MSIALAFHHGMLQKEQQRAAPLGSHSTQEKPQSPLSSPHCTTMWSCGVPLSLIQRVDYFRRGGGKSSSDELLSAEPRLDTPGVRQAPHTTQRFGCSQRAQLASYINDLRAAPRAHQRRQQMLRGQIHPAPGRRHLISSLASSQGAPGALSK